jgi:hypothetical protein
MRTLTTLLAAVTLCLVGPLARADYFSKSLTMRYVDSWDEGNGHFSNDDNHTTSDLQYTWDQPMYIEAPPTGVARQGRLAVMLHGHSGSPKEMENLVHFAAGLGFHVISIDYDYGNDALNPNDPTKNYGPRHVCGCYTDCYGQFHALILEGQGHAGLPPPGYPVHSRLRNVLQFLTYDKTYGQNNNGWGNFLNGTDVDWSKVVLVGQSRGSSLAAYLAKYYPLNRLLMFSGDHDELNNGGPADTAGDGVGPATTYGYGNANHLGTCTFTTGSPAYLVDNQWNKPGATWWQTQREQMYAFSNEGDTVAPYYQVDVYDSNNQTQCTAIDTEMEYQCTSTPGTYVYHGTLVALDALHLADLGVAWVGTYHSDIDRTGNWKAWERNSPHWLTAGFMSPPDPADGNFCGAPASTPPAGVDCNVPYPGPKCFLDPHDATINGTCISSGVTIRPEVWRYMFLN